MSGTDPRRGVVSALEAVGVARERAERAEAAASGAAAAAGRQDALAAAGGPSADVHARLAVRHRESERRQRVAARVQRDYAWSMTYWIVQREEYGLGRPVLMGAVADNSGWRGAVLTLWTRAGVEKLVAASDAQARRAHELEVALGEGPSWEAMRGRCSAASGAELRRLWPRYGPVVAELGVRAVAAVPVTIGSEYVGSLTVTGAAVPVDWEDGRLVDLAEALRHVLSAPDVLNLEEPDLPGVEQLEAEDFQPELHQAAGVLHERYDLPMDDAIAVIRAHAYAEERSVADVATEVVAGGVLEP